jgi:dCTP deaminase
MHTSDGRERKQEALVYRRYCAVIGIKSLTSNRANHISEPLTLPSFCNAIVYSLNLAKEDSSPMILTAQQIEETYRKSDILIDPFDETQIQGATYDLRVGERGATTTSKKIVNIKDHGYLPVEPGDIGLIEVLEIIRLGPQYVGRFGLRSKYARKGLVATTGAQIDPGYHGRLIVGIMNLTPKLISLPYKDDFLSVEFHRLEEPTTKPYDGSYQNKMGLGPEDIEFITEQEGVALSETLTTLRALSQNVASLAAEVKVLKWAVPVIVGFGITVIGVIVAIK